MNSVVFWLRVFLVAGIAGGVAFLLAGLLPKSYSSYSSLYFPSQSSTKSAPLGALGLGSADAEGGSIPILKGALNSPVVGSGPSVVTGIVKSRTCLSEVITKLGLVQKWDLTPTKTRERLDLAVQCRNEKSGFLVIEVTEEAPQLCVDILKAIDAHLQKRSKELTLNFSASNRKFVEAKYLEAQENVDEARRRLSNKLARSLGEPTALQKVYFDTRIRLDEARAERDRAREQLVSLETSAKKALSGNQSFEGSLSALSAAGGDGAAASQVYSKLALELQQRRIELIDAGKIFQKSTPEYRAAKEKNDAIERLVQSAISGEKSRVAKGTHPQLAKVKAELSGLDAAVKAYSGLIGNYKSQAKTAVTDSATALDEQEQFKSALQERATLRVELMAATVAEQRDPARYEIVDSAEIDPEPVAPKKRTFIILGAFLALALQLAPLARKREPR